MEHKIEDIVVTDLSQQPELKKERLQLAAAKAIYDLLVHQNTSNELGLVSEVDEVKVDLASTTFEDLPEAHRAALIKAISTVLNDGGFNGVGLVVDALNLPCYLWND
jgi:hypothetical protein